MPEEGLGVEHTATLLMFWDSAQQGELLEVLHIDHPDSVQLSDGSALDGPCGEEITISSRGALGGTLAILRTTTQYDLFLA